MGDPRQCMYCGSDFSVFKSCGKKIIKKSRERYERYSLTGLHCPQEQINELCEELSLNPDTMVPSKFFVCRLCRKKFRHTGTKDVPRSNAKDRRYPSNRPRCPSRLLLDPDFVPDGDTLYFLNSKADATVSDCCGIATIQNDNLRASSSSSSRPTCTVPGLSNATRNMSTQGDNAVWNEHCYTAKTSHINRDTLFSDTDASLSENWLYRQHIQDQATIQELQQKVGEEQDRVKACEAEIARLQAEIKTLIQSIGH
ncbi:hypothetical protein BaRGS_00004044 [Batillaria attramentaria]|uniref:Uncharacterized protein n=1 Tax=Batillaria attramentaria TaxID=370345 RepID=A0ABD0LZV7_9CAEN